MARERSTRKSAGDELQEQQATGNQLLEKYLFGETAVDQLQKIGAKQISAKQFPGFINWIRFPYFKNLRPDEIMYFKFPLTIVTGANGTGKSSILQALYGAPDQQNVGRYWFSMETDPIREADGSKRNSFVYEYYDSTGVRREPIKVRVQRKLPDSVINALKIPSNRAEHLLDPDYWEPSRPLQWAGQTLLPDGQRDPQVPRSVVYFHFRTTLSAFERYFYQDGAPSILHREKIRQKSRRLKTSLHAGRVYKPRGVLQARTPMEFSAEVLKVVSYVLDKRYKSATRLEHKHFGGVWGTTISIESENFGHYSDAFAGSGESAIFNLIYAIDQAAPNSLVLLDEPETSLHPKAQTRLQRYLVSVALAKKLQIIISSHAPTFTANMPTGSIIVLTEAPDGKFVFMRDVPSDLAMATIGHYSSQSVVLVEDVLCEKMAKYVYEQSDEFEARRIVFNVAPGAPAVLALMAQDVSKQYLCLLDGDQRPSEAALSKINELAEKRLPSEENYDELLRSIFHENTPTKFYHSGSSDAAVKASRGVEVRRRFCQRIVDGEIAFMPGKKGAENLLLNVDRMTEFLEFHQVGGPDREYILQQSEDASQCDAKAVFVKCAEVTGTNYETVVDTFYAQWKKAKDSTYIEFTKVLKQLCSKIREKQTFGGE